MARDIALFGLSANPPTGSTGHVGIIRALAAGGSFDEVWVAPVYIHIYASKSNMAPYADRIAMCKLCFEPESTEQCSVVVLDIEREVFEWTAANTGGGGGSGNTTGTIDVIMYIKQKHTDVNIHLILGGDTFQDLAAGKWKDSERIFDAASVHVFPRIGAPPIVSDKPFKQIEWLDGLHPKTDHEGTSSTLVRSMSPYGALWPLCRSPKASLELHVHPDVVKYMEARGLYMFAPEILRRYWRQRALFSAFHVVAITMMYLNS